MEPLSIGLLGLGAASGLLNYLQNSSANDRANLVADQAVRDRLAIAIPDPHEFEVALERFVNQGELTPVFEQAIAADPTEFNKITTNATHRGAQNRALQELERIGSEGGMGLRERGQLEEAHREAAGHDQSMLNNILSQHAQRGTSGSGVELAAKLQAAAQGGDRYHRDTMQAAASAQERALRAIESAGGLATQYRGQEHGEQAQRAAAQDVLNRFNTGDIRNTASANAGERRNVMRYNRGEGQRLHEANVGLGHREQAQTVAARRQHYEDTVNRANDVNNIRTNQQAGIRHGGQLAANAISNIGGAAINTLAAHQARPQAPESTPRPAMSATESPYQLSYPIDESRGQPAWQRLNRNLRF